MVRRRRPISENAVSTKFAEAREEEIRRQFWVIRATNRIPTIASRMAAAESGTETEKFSAACRPDEYAPR
jgi:hypothetical protein